MADAPIYGFELSTLAGKPLRLADYAGTVLLLVNTASKCGFTPQLAGLQDLHARYAARGFSVIGFPCNQFGGQEPGEADEIQEFCQINYGVGFPISAKIEVNGEHADPLWRYLKEAKPGLLGTEAIKWNFTKFLVGRDGRTIRRYAPSDSPEKIAPDIEAALEAK